MTRLTSLAIVIALTGTAHVARAQSQAELASHLNDEGRELFLADKYDEAAKKFQEAVARDPEAKYFINLCTALLQTGKFGAALSACNAVENYNPSAEQKERTSKLIGRINDEAKAQNLDLHTTHEDPRTDPLGGTSGTTSGTIGTTTANTTTTNGTEPPPPTIGRPLTQSLVAAGPPDNRYTWTLGIDFFGGGGQVGAANAYGSAIGGLRVKADYLVIPESRIGTQAYLQVSHLGQGRNDVSDAQTLDIFDVGIAGYKDWCPGGTPRLCFTPLVGAQLSLMSPAGEMDDAGSQVFNYAALGARVELAMSVAFGRRYEHVFSVMAGANLYTPVLAGPSADSGSLTIAQAGLDSGGVVGYFGIGYTYRFNTPLGGRPFVILE